MEGKKNKKKLENISVSFFDEIFLWDISLEMMEEYRTIIPATLASFVISYIASLAGKWKKKWGKKKNVREKEEFSHVGL